MTAAHDCIAASAAHSAASTALYHHSNGRVACSTLHVHQLHVLRLLRCTHQVAVHAVQIELLDGYNLVQGLAQCPVHLPDTHHCVNNAGVSCCTLPARLCHLLLVPSLHGVNSNHALHAELLPHRSADTTATVVQQLVLVRISRHRLPVGRHM